MPRPITTVLVAILVCATMSSCRDSTRSAPGGNPDGVPQYATTIYAFRAILEAVVGSNGMVRNLLPAGASPHTYEPRPSDVRFASDARMLFYGAPELDSWASDLGSAPSIALIDLLPDSLLLDLPDSGHEGDGHHHAAGRDPHFWMDPMRVNGLLPVLVEKLCHLDAAACSDFRSNADAFSARLGVLNDSVRTILAPVRDRALLLSHPFIQYFAEQYGLRTAGVIEEMPGSEPTARDMHRIVRSVRQSEAGAIVTVPQLSDRAARAVSETVGIPVVELDPIGGPGDRDTYEKLILHNALELRRGLERKD